MGIKKILLGEKMPDKDDPRYKKRHDHDVAAGRSFAESLRLDKAAACVQGFALRHSKLFLALVFSFVLFSIALNLYRICSAVKYRQNPSSATERQESELVFSRHHMDDAQRECISYKKVKPSERDDYEDHRED